MAADAGATTTSPSAVARHCRKNGSRGRSCRRPSTAYWRSRMDKLEQYLEQVCRGIGGPRAMRQHIREELREHLNDAVDDHVAHGMTREAAIDRALEDF